MNLEMQSSRTTLEDFYGPKGYLVTVQDHGAAGPAAMLELVQLLRLAPEQRRAWGTTHHQELALTAEDRAGATEYIRIRATDAYNYWIEYRMPEVQAPWPDAWVQGLATSPSEAASMVLTSLERCEGWQVSPSVS